MPRLLDQFSVLLLDMNGTFMFGEDRFGADEDFYATYCALGGTALGPNEVRTAIRSCYEGMLGICRSPEKFDSFLSLAEGLRRYAGAPEGELPLLERVFAAHERGFIPPDYAALLCRLSKTHQLGLVSNIWARKEPWLAEFDRAGISDVFACKVFSSDGRSIKPSEVLFRRALESFPEDSRILFVGDSLRRDVEPAKALGLATAWINPRGGDSPCADYVLPSLLAIEDWVCVEPSSRRD
jgi:putative hydrolase of the HAD superfamily